MASFSARCMAYSTIEMRKPVVLALRLTASSTSWIDFFKASSIKRATSSFRSPRALMDSSTAWQFYTR